MGIWKPPVLTTLMGILTIPPAQLNDYDLVLLPLSLFFLVRVSPFSLLSSWNWGFFLTICHTTIPTSRSPATHSVFSSRCLSLFSECKLWKVKKKMHFLFFLNILLKSFIIFLSRLLWLLKQFSCLPPWPLLSHTSPCFLWVRFLRLGCRGYFTS